MKPISLIFSQDMGKCDSCIWPLHVKYVLLSVYTVILVVVVLHYNDTCNFFLLSKLLVISGADWRKPGHVTPDSWVHVVRSGRARVHACSWLCTWAVPLRPRPIRHNCMEKHHTRLGWMITCVLCFSFKKICLLNSLYPSCALTEHIYNFKKQVTNNLNSPYDYSSVMHYGRWATLSGSIIKHLACLV